MDVIQSRVLWSGIRPLLTKARQSLPQSERHPSRAPPGDDFDIPTDLLQLRRDFQAANAAWADATDRDVAQGAYEKAVRLAEEIQDHDWWGTVEDKFKARMALLVAAQDQA